MSSLGRRFEKLFAIASGAYLLQNVDATVSVSHAATL
jgi:hypothetical protein